MRDVPRLLPVLLGLLMVLGAAPRAPAQGLRVTRLGGTVELGADLRLQEFDGPEDNDREFDRQRFTERLGLDLDGYVLDPGLLRFDLGGSFGLRQTHFDSSGGRSSSEHGTIFGYNGILQILADQPVSLSLFANRFEGSVNQSAAADTDASGEAVGATLHSFWPVFPFTLSWKRVSGEMVSRGGFIESRRDESRELIEFSGQHVGESLQARLQLRDEDIDDRSIPPVGDFRVREANGMLGYRWGPYFEKSWRTSARYFERKGRFSFENASADTSFIWDVTETFSATLEHDIQRSDSEGAVTTRNGLLVSLNHQLYESLSSHLGFFGERSDRDEGVSRSYGTDFSTNYRKHLPWDTRLLMNAAIRYRVQDDDLDSQDVQVLGESLFVADFFGNFLANQRIDPSTVEVFEGLDGPLLIEGLDYELEVIGARVAIDILPTGAVEVGDTLAVNYRFRVDPGSKVGTTDLSFGIGWDSDWFLVRYDHARTRQRRLEGEEDTFLEDSERDSVRVDLNGELRNLRAAVGAQYLRDRSVTVEYQELSLTQLLRWQPRRGLNAIIRFRESWRDFSRPRRDSEILTASGWLMWQPRPEWSLRLFADFRRFDDSQSPDQRDLEVGLRGSFRFARIEILPTISWSRNQRGGSESRDLLGMLRIVRSF